MPTKSALIKHPIILRCWWLFDIAVAVAAPVIAFLHYEDGRPMHGVFWMAVAIWSGRGASIRYLAMLINDPKAEPTSVIVKKPSEE